MSQNNNIITDSEVVSFSEPGVIRIWFWGKICNKKLIGISEKPNDAEYLADLYLTKNTEAFSLIDGRFTCIVWTPEQTLIARDHHGTSLQVYYTDKYYASSLELLQSTPGFKSSPNFVALSSFLNVGYIATPDSALQGVKKLGAGEVLIYNNGKIFCHNLFSTSSIIPVSAKMSLEDYSRTYGNLHSDAIRRRIEDSANVGILLSGGYDSGCNLVGLRNIYDGEINSYSIGFKGDNWTELPLARCMSQTFNTNHHEYEIDGSEITALPSIVRELGDPFVEGGLMVNYSVMKMIGQDKPSVILGGDGSDQYFGTSGREVALHFLISKYGLKGLMNMLFRMLSHESFDKNNRAYRLRFHLDKILNILQGDLFGFPEFRLRQMLRDLSFMPPVKIDESDNISFEHLYVQHTYSSDIEKIINQVILFKSSRMAEMFSNNLTYPYMDLELYKFLRTVPVEFKCKGDSVKDIAKGRATAKFLLKYHYKPMLPDVITSKKKQGGFAPMPIFFKDDAMRARIADFVMSSSVVSDYLKKSAVESFIKKYDSEVKLDGNWFWYKQNRAIQYFNLLTCAIWWEQYIKGNRDISL